MKNGVVTARRSSSLSGSLRPPGDKSISHRALILGALAKGKTKITGLLESLDVLATAQAIRSFGAEVQREGEGCWRVAGRPWQSPAGPIDCGNSGTTARLLMGACAGYAMRATFIGDGSLSRRPMDRVLGPLRLMGARVSAAEGDCLPVIVEGGGLGGIRFASPVPSAQVKSAILLAGLNAAGDVEIEESAPSRDHTEQMLEAFGCDITFGRGFARLGKRRLLHGTDIDVPSDPSSAAFPIVAAVLVPGSRIVLRNVLNNPLRAGLLESLNDMGAGIRVTWLDAQTADLEVVSTPLRAIEVPAERVPSMIDEFPILAVAAAFAEGRTILRGLAELRVKESDRFAAIVRGLRACGVKVEANGDDLMIEGQKQPKGGARILAQGDHRIAMSFLILGLASEEPVSVDCAAAIATSYPGFVEHMRRLGADIS